MRTAVVAGLVLGGITSTAWASDAFEIQVYDGTANAAGAVGLELHVNGVASGRTSAIAPEAPANHQAHFTLEPSYGVTSSWELGAYVQSAWRPSGELELAGVKLRSKLVTPPGWRPHLRAGLNLEVGYLPPTYDADRWGGEVRPILAWEDRWVLLAINPIVGVPLRAGGRPTFEPAIVAAVKVGALFSCGVEYYADLGPLVAPSRARDQEHYLFEVLNLIGVRGFELNAGVGEGLTAASNGLVVKLIVGHAWNVGARPESSPRP